MKLTDVIVLAVIISLFSTVFVTEITELKKMDLLLEQLQMKNSSLRFISESFYSTCEGKGFSSLNEWEKTCKSLWQLEEIKWELLLENGSSDKYLICASWLDSSGEKKVYYRVNKEKLDRIK